MSDEYVSPIGLDVKILEDSFSLLASQGDKLVSKFYKDLFKRYPDVVPLFAHTTPAQQQTKLLTALKMVVENIRNPDALASTFTAMGVRHHGYGVQKVHYIYVITTLIDVMKELAGAEWSDRVELAWTQALNIVAKMMTDATNFADIQGVSHNENNTKVAEMTGTADGAICAIEKQELDRLRSAIGGAMQAMMMIDRDFNITYVNQSTINMLKKHEHTFRRVYPDFDSVNVIGTNIDQFHKNPAHQRQLLSNPANLPYSANIQVGPLSFKLNVTAMISADGEYIGNALEWADITDILAKENHVARLQGSVDGSMQAIMMVDLDFIVTYINQATMDLLSKYEMQFTAVFTGFITKNIIGTCIDIFHKNPAHQRKLLADPTNCPYQTDISIGDLKFALNVTATMDADGKHVGNSLEWSDVTELRRKEIQVARLQSAVDGAEANLMICDTDLVITYANPSVVSMMANRAEDLRKIFPGFNANNLVGQCIDQFHKDPSHQRQILGNPANLPYLGELKMAGFDFTVNATAILDHEGNMMGNMVEWCDITEQKDAEHQVQNLINSAVKGDLNTRIDASKYKGFMSGLAEGINELMDAVVNPLQAAQQVIVGLSDGDLTREMEGEYSGVFGDLKDSLNITVDNLSDMVDKILMGSGSILISADEISRGNTDLSQRTEEQASSLQQTASSMEQMTATVKQNADHARQASQLAKEARDQAEKGGVVVQSAVTAMSEINTSSKKIADIISVIDEIAFQTNLLALNAAVEAARAGEQGRGFAVVAAEVRNLAQRSAGAAKEIKGLISDSVDKVGLGSRLVDESGKTLEEIVNAVKKVNDIIYEIATASQEQSIGIEEVNKAITQMDEMTQQNAALVEEATAASEAMNDEAKVLDDLMQFFTIDEYDEEPVIEPPRRRTRAARREQAEHIEHRPVRRPKRIPPPEDDGDEWEEF